MNWLEFQLENYQIPKHIVEEQSAKKIQQMFKRVKRIQAWRKLGDFSH